MNLVCQVNFHERNPNNRYIFSSQVAAIWVVRNLISFRNKIIVYYLSKRDHESESTDMKNLDTILHLSFSYWSYCFTFYIVTSHNYTQVYPVWAIWALSTCEKLVLKVVQKQLKIHSWLKKKSQLLIKFETSLCLLLDFPCMKVL